MIPRHTVTEMEQDGRPGDCSRFKAPHLTRNLQSVFSCDGVVWSATYCFLGRLFYFCRFIAFLLFGVRFLVGCGLV